MDPGLLETGWIDCFLENGMNSLNGSSSAIMMRSIIHSAVIHHKYIVSIVTSRLRGAVRRADRMELLLVRVPNAGLFNLLTASAVTR